MELVSLLSLVTDYEVPPREIVDAINSRKLHPVAPPDGGVSLGTISFPSDEVSNLFWAYELKSKSAETKAELIRRFQKHDAITASIIGAVVGTGTVLLADILKSKKDENPIKRTPQAAWVSGRFWSDRGGATPTRSSSQRFPQDFIVPVEPEPGFKFRFRNTEILISRPAGEYINIQAAADGHRVANVLRPIQEAERSILLQHDHGWFTLYEALGNTVMDAFMIGATFGQGHRIAHCHPVPGVRPEISFSMWHRGAGSDLVPAPTYNLDWPNVPGSPRL